MSRETRRIERDSDQPSTKLPIRRQSKLTVSTSCSPIRISKEHSGVRAGPESSEASELNRLKPPRSGGHKRKLCETLITGKPAAPRKRCKLLETSGIVPLSSTSSVEYPTDSIELFGPSDDALSEHSTFSPDHSRTPEPNFEPPPPGGRVAFLSLPTPPSSTSSQASCNFLQPTLSNDQDLSNDDDDDVNRQRAPPMLSLEANLVLLKTVKELAVTTTRMQDDLNRSTSTLHATLMSYAVPLERLERRMEYQASSLDRLARHVSTLMDNVEWLIKCAPQPTGQSGRVKRRLGRSNDHASTPKSQNSHTLNNINFDERKVNHVIKCDRKYRK